MIDRDDYLKVKRNPKLRARFAENIKAQRLHLGLTQLELSKKMAGGSRSKISQWEDGKHFPTQTWMAHLLEALETDLITMATTQTEQEMITKDLSLVAIYANEVNKAMGFWDEDHGTKVGIELKVPGFYEMSITFHNFNTEESMTLVSHFEGKELIEISCFRDEERNKWAPVSLAHLDNLKKCYEEALKQYESQTTPKEA